MTSLPNLHLSKSDFPDIRLHGELYVDKTPCFRQLLEVGRSPLANVPPSLLRTHQFLARPRRFGKSLLISTLETWFQGLPPDHPLGSPDDVDSWSALPLGWSSPNWLWDGLDGASWHGIHGWHPVIKLDMSGGSSWDPSAIGPNLKDGLMNVVNMWEHWGVSWGKGRLARPNSQSSPYYILTQLIYGLYVFYGQKPVVLVDEYDAPITKHIGTQTDLAPVVSELQELYRVLKDSGGRLYGVIMTGITRFARDSLFSALNNIVDISDWALFADICGFTEEEVLSHFTPYGEQIQKLEPALQDQDIQAQWRSFYNGYRFSPEPDAPRVYNPFTLLDCIQTLTVSRIHRLEAAAGKWPIGWSRSGSPAFLARLAMNSGYPLPSADRTHQLYEGPILDVQKPPYANLMLETGYYTWLGDGEEEPLHLGYPNREVAQTFARDVLSVWHSQPEWLPEWMDGMREALMAGQVEKFMTVLTQLCYGFPYEDLSHEASCRAVMHLICQCISDRVQSEKHNWGGRSDHELQVGQTVYVMEVKYNQSVSTAWDQLERRGYGQEHGGGALTVVGIALAFHRNQEIPPRIDHLSKTLFRPEIKNGDYIIQN